MVYSEKHTCLICGHRATETLSTPFQCLHCGGLGFFAFLLAPPAVPRPVRPPGQWQPAHRAPDEAPK